MSNSQMGQLGRPLANKPSHFKNIASTRGSAEAVRAHGELDDSQLDAVTGASSEAQIQSAIATMVSEVIRDFDRALHNAAKG